MSSYTLGLWALGTEARFHDLMNARSAKNVIKAAYKKGIHSFDSAFSYGSDSLLYSALKEISVKTEEVEIFEKVMPYKSLRLKAEASLRALKRDDVDSLIIHWPSDEDILYPALREAEKLLDQKKAKTLGLSNFPPSYFKTVYRDFPISVNEYFSSPTMVNEKISGVMNLKYGIFSFGSLLRDDSLSDKRSSLFYYLDDAKEAFLDLKKVIDEIAKENNVSRKCLLLSFAAFDNPERIIIGSSKVEHLEELNTIELKEEDYNKIIKASKALSEFNKSDNIFSHIWKKS